MANTIPDGIYYPENTTDMELDTILATMASSIQNGIGKRVAKLETFVGCNLGMAASFEPPTLGVVTKVNTYGVQSAAVAPGTFNSGMTVTNGTVTVPEDGLYSVMFTANFLPIVATAARLNTYIYVNGVNHNFSSGYGMGATDRYSNCNVVAIYNLKKNDQIDVRVNVTNNRAELVGSTGSSFCVSLVSRTLS